MRINQKIKKTFLKDNKIIKNKKYNFKWKKRKLYIKLIENTKLKQFLIIFLLLILIIILFQPKKIKQMKHVNMYISTHKDFDNNIIINPTYIILCDEKSQLKKEYKIDIIETNKNNILYPKRRGYSEGSKIYPIWKSYKDGNLSSKYIGLFHYRRIFPFKNDIPELDKIFNDYDIIIKSRFQFRVTTREQYNQCHIAHFLDESINIIQEKYPEYYPYAKSFLAKKWGYFCNIFIMKQDDFIKWGEFVFGVLLEFDKKYNLTSDEDIEKLIRNETKKLNTFFDINYQSRVESFLMERIGNIFYEKHFHKRYEIETVDIK